MYTSIKNYCDKLATEFDNISTERKATLEKIADYIKKKMSEGKPANLISICTHNSRRSHFAQVWASVAGSYYGIRNIYSFSGGVEVTAFNPNAIAALERAGFHIHAESSTENPIYDVQFDEQAFPALCFSKLYSDAENPQKDFAAIMVCGSAEESCPLVNGADQRFSLTFEDPKDFDGTPQQNEKYDERCKEIATQMMYLFSKVK